MSTRALINIRNDEGVTLVTIHKHWDGYPESPGVGSTLEAFVDLIKIVNGIGSEENVANGMECLAAQVIAHLKDGPGDVYIYPPDTKNMSEEFIYTIQAVEGRPVVSWEAV